jgi:hypothetical protein
MTTFYVTRMIRGVVLYSDFTVEAESYSEAVELAMNSNVDWSAPDETENFGDDIVKCVSNFDEGVTIDSMHFDKTVDHCLSNFGSKVDQLAATQRAERLAERTPKAKGAIKKGSRL